MKNWNLLEKSWRKITNKLQKTSKLQTRSWKSYIEAEQIQNLMYDNPFSRLFMIFLVKARDFSDNYGSRNMGGYYEDGLSSKESLETLKITHEHLLGKSPVCFSQSS